jgi:hypothetical protein
MNERGPRLQRLTLENFRSYRQAEVTFDTITFLVGRNGAGKSNLLDALRFLAGAPRIPLRDLLEARTGPYFVARHLPIRDESWFRLSVQCAADGGSTSYMCWVFPMPLIVTKEVAVREEDGDTAPLFSRGNQLLNIAEPGIAPAVYDDELIFPSLAGTTYVRPLADSLRSIRVFDIDPDAIRRRIEPDNGAELVPNGENAASVIRQLMTDQPQEWETVRDLLKAAVPSIEEVTIPSSLPTVSIIEFRLRGFGQSILHTDMSDGTLGLLGNLLALFSTPEDSVVVLEEPERSLHPGAMGVLQDAIHAAGKRRQVIVTTQSPDLLDARWIGADNLRIVQWTENGSQVSEVSKETKEALQRHLFLAGELLRSNSLLPAVSETSPGSLA